jgi:hypothetical protein
MIVLLVQCAVPELRRIEPEKEGQEFVRRLSSASPKPGDSMTATVG